MLFASLRMVRSIMCYSSICIINSQMGTHYWNIAMDLWCSIMLKVYIIMSDADLYN